jgi:3-mercaptopyruvate sulfurtransferase SseA
VSRTEVLVDAAWVQAHSGGAGVVLVEVDEDTGNNNWFAAYAYWYFKLYGHPDVRLLDGGRKKWELDSRLLVTDVPQRATTAYRAQEQDPSIRAHRDEVIAAPAG